MLAAGDFVQITFRGVWNLQRVMLVRTYRLQGAAPGGNTLSADYQDIYDQIKAGAVQDIETPYLDCLPPSYTLESVRIQAVAPVRYAFQDFLVGDPGSNGNDARVGFSQAAMTFRSIFAGAREHGTCRIGPIPDDVTTAGTLNAAYITNFLTPLAQALEDPIAPATWGLSVVVPVIATPPYLQWSAIASWYIRTTTSTQRTRVVGRGE